jgi:hypothetical protein
MAPAMTFEEVIGEASTGDAAVAEETGTAIVPPTETAVAEATATEVVPAEETPLSDEQRTRLEHLETDITKASGTFADSFKGWYATVGKSLSAIKDENLYREQGDWGTYLDHRWAFSRQRAHQLMKGAACVNDLVAVGLPAPESEGAVRSIATAPADKRVEVWSKAVEGAKDRKPTQRHVREALAELGLKTEKPKAERPKAEPEPGPRKVVTETRRPEIDSGQPETVLNEFRQMADTALRSLVSAENPFELAVGWLEQALADVVIEIEGEMKEGGTNASNG